MGQNSNNEKTNNITHVDFVKKMKDLHGEICNEIALLMRVHHVTELDLLGTDASHAIIQMEDKFTGETSEVEVEKVILHEEEATATPYGQFGEVYITSADWGYADEEICLRHNQYIIPCSIRDLYETVYEELEVKRVTK